MKGLRIGVVTLGVADLDRAVRFYRDGLGLPLHAVKSGVAYFALAGAWLALFPRESLGRYAGLDAAGPAPGFSGVTLSHNVAAREEVDAVMAAAESAGARLVRPAAPASWGGYDGWFADPDGHLWEVVWNPRPFVPNA